MFSTRKRLGAGAIVGIALAALAVPTAAQAAEPIVLPAGLACEFELSILETAPAKTVTRQNTDAAGNPVEVVAGRGPTLVLTNEDTGDAVTLPGRAYTQTTTTFVDGSTAWRATGHYLIAQFPTDIPAGPSTTLYIGTVSFTISAEGVTTLGASVGRTRDICAELS